MKIGIFGGSFDPVHVEHVHMAKAAIEELGLDRLYVVPSYLAPHKQNGAVASGEERLEACRIAFRELHNVEVSDLEILAEGTSYSYLTCRAFQERFPSAQLFFLVGADMLENFFSWKNPSDILNRVTLVACGRGNAGTEEYQRRFQEEFGKEYLQLSFCGRAVSSTRIRVDLAFGKRTEMLDDNVRAYLDGRGTYAYPCIQSALALLKPSRIEHSYRVAVMAADRAKSVGVSQEKAILASALHDCGKYLNTESELLKGFSVEEDVPPPVVHQFSSAYLAEHAFGITDEEILDAVCYHTSGKAGMSTLSKLIYLCDLLEDGREFEGITPLREAFYRDLDECFFLALRHQLQYLHMSGKPVYSLTEEAYRYELNKKGEGYERL